MFTKVIISIAVFSAFLGLGVSAQSAAPPPLPTSTSQLTPCILNCTFQGVAASDCTSPTDLACICTSTAFQQATQQCLTSQCTAQEVATADALQGPECANFTSSASGSATAASNSNSTATSSTPNATTTGASAAAGTGTGAGAGAGAGTNSNSNSPTSPTSPTNSPTSPTTPSTNTNSTNTNPPATSSNAAGLAQQFTFGATHVVGLASALAGVLAGFTILL